MSKFFSHNIQMFFNIRREWFISLIIKLYYYFLCKNIYDICIRADTWYYISSQTLRLIITSIDISLTKEIEVISVRENNETNVSIPAIGTHRIWRGKLRRSLRGRGNDKFCRNARDITVTFSAAARELRDTGLILMQRRLIYAAAPFRTATLKTLTAFNFRWPSILFSLVWTTFSRTGYPAPLRHAPHASAKEITCPLPPLRRIRRCSFHPLCPLLPFTDRVLHCP